MARLEAPEPILDQVQMLDQQVATPLAGAQQPTNVRERRVVHDAAFRSTLAARARCFRSHWKALSLLACPGWSQQGGICKTIDYLSRFDLRDVLAELDHAVGIHQ